MKKIVSLRENDRGFFIDLEDQPSSIAVNRKTRDVLLDEGGGNDRYHGAALFGEDNPRFSVEISANGIDVYLEFGVDRDRHFVGQSTDPQVERWVCHANQALGGVAVPFSLPMAEERILHMVGEGIPLTQLVHDLGLSTDEVCDQFYSVVGKMNTYYRFKQDADRPVPHSHVGAH